MNFRHVTLNTGHAAIQERSMVADTVIGMLADLIVIAIDTGKARLPSVPGYYLTVTSPSRHACLAGIWHDDGAAIMSISICLKARHGAEIWRLMHQTAQTPLRTKAEDQPAAPWIADRIEAGISSHADAIQWTGDFSRCLAWAWADYAS